MIVFAVVRPGEFNFRPRGFFLPSISDRDLSASLPLRLYPNRMSSNDPTGSRTENTPTTRMVVRYDSIVEEIGLPYFYVTGASAITTPTCSKTKSGKLNRIER